MGKCQRIIIWGRSGRFLTTKTGTHVIYRDVVSGRQRKVNLSDMKKYHYIYNTKQK